MSADLLLPGMPSDTATGRKRDGQWTLQRLQLVNWGGFEGHHSLEFNPRGSLITGGSGTGKSTILDAYIALMMDSNVPFNGASNDSGTGRARSAEQRNLLSYMRGLTDMARDEDSGDAREQVLRGDGIATWSAIGATWRHTDGTRHTALRVYFADASATTSRDVTTHFIQIPGEFTLTALEPYAAERFHHGRLGRAFPTMTFATGYAQWAAALHVRLGVGRDGDGSPAMRLLARIQAGRAITSVDGLYKDMVLERPKTYDAANNAVEHFAELVTSYELMRTAQAQVDALEPAAALYSTLRDAESDIELLDTFGLNSTATTTPVALWRTHLEADLLDTEVTAAKTARDQAHRNEQTAATQVREHDEKLIDNRRLQRENGGDALERISLEIEQYTAALEQVRTARAQFAPQAPGLDLPASAEALDALQAQAQTYIDTHQSVIDDIDTEREQLGGRRWPLSDQRRQLQEEQRYLQGRRNLIPQTLDAARAAIAAHVNIDLDELPFVAELIDLKPEYDDWREAAELVLGGFGQTLLVDERHRDFRRILNSLRLNPRINFELVPTGLLTRTFSPAMLPGRLQFDPNSPYLGWLHNTLERNFNFECLNSPEFPDDNRRRVTITGQVQNGRRGAHGGHGSRRILGFSPAARLHEIADELTALDGQLGELDREDQTLRTRRAIADAQHRTSSYILTLHWPQLDLTSADGALEDAQERQTRLLASSDLLTDLKAIEVQLMAAREDWASTRTREHDTYLREDGLWGQLVELQDTANRELERLLDYGVTLSEEQTARLNEEYLRYSSTGKHAEIDDVLTRMQRGLLAQTERARTARTSSAAALVSLFKGFQQRWPQPNLGEEASSYPEYEKILNELKAEGLATRREEFTKRVIDWSSEDLLGLAGAYEDAFDDITSRLEPVNEVLAQLPFGPRADRLRIRLRPLRSADVTAFRQQLTALASSSTRITADQVDERFTQLRTFMARIEPSATTRERDQLLDVRRHVHVEAERLDATTGDVQSIYDSLGSKSGGESQELAAFIVGAALRYRLGIEDNSLPGYAPVLLDEAFIKSDSEFAGRAVRAWQALGFQLIVGAPLDKVSALEPYVDQMTCVVKANGYSHTYPLHAEPAGIPPQGPA